ncbi:uroporphyrinogen decarboxylase [Calidithermus chliarophilus]|uniref:uroporphyrinogen decarboxylase n=1 Tax=Calidithermus chliarophilus TaxID=52023 RepID=UPI0004219ADA|nr:uroporphyrinogen decarboxylase [Calidithermus chliarophilus]
MNESVRNSRFLKAARLEPTDATPVWFMRQAGRYMPEYRALRAKTTMLGAIQDPALAAEITLQPIHAFDLDAAILFNDILTPLIGMGLELDFVEGKGPVIGNAIASLADVERLMTPSAAEAMPYTAQAIRLVTAELDGRGLPLIGFVGAPFTLASYAVEGGGSRNYEKTKRLMYHQPEAWAGLMDKLVHVLEDYLLFQAQAGCAALQVFDSWAGALSPRDYARFVAPYNARLIAAAKESGVPVIYFSTGTGTLLRAISALGSDVVGVDWRIGLDEAWAQIGHDRAIQGNLEPLLLQAPWEELERQARAVLEEAAGRAGHIFNLGHGILPQTPPDNVARLADFVHEFSAKGVVR